MSILLKLLRNESPSLTETDEKEVLREANACRPVPPIRRNIPTRTSTPLSRQCGDLPYRVLCGSARRLPYSFQEIRSRHSGIRVIYLLSSPGQSDDFVIVCFKTALMTRKNVLHCCSAYPFPDIAYMTK